jgi:RNA-binding protein Musashi
VYSLCGPPLLAEVENFADTRYTDSLKGYFSQFGEVSECTVMRDSATGRSRGFGFLTFKDPKCVNIVMVKEHYLDGKIVC